MSSALAHVRRPGAKLGWVVVWALLLIAPYQLSSFWELTGLFAMGAIIGAIGLTILTGTAGQLSLAHAFFLAVGAYGYCYFAGSSGGTTAASHVAGLGLPPLLALVLAVLLAGLCGALFSPISARLGGVYLGIASIGLVFVGQHILFNAESLTGGFNGRDAPPFSLFGFHFEDGHPNVVIGGSQFGGLEKLWYLGLLLVVLAYAYARLVVSSRPGRALETVRDNEVAAAVMGVDVKRYKAAAFTLSSMYAGLAGVVLALAFERLVPDTFGFALSISYLVMIVIGGLGSVGGAALGAIFVSVLPQVFDHYSGSLPLLSPEGGSGLQASQAARFLYGAAILLVLLKAPGGLAGLGRRLRGGSGAEPPPVPAEDPSASTTDPVGSSVSAPELKETA